MTQPKAYRWDYRASPLIRVGFWLLLLGVGVALNWAGHSEVKVYWQGQGYLERHTNAAPIFRLHIPLADATKIRVGMPVTINWTALPRAVYGTSQGAIQKIEVAGQHLQAAVVLDNPLLQTPGQDQTLRPGLGGTARVAISHRKALDLLWEWLKGP